MMSYFAGWELAVYHVRPLAVSHGYWMKSQLFLECYTSVWGGNAPIACFIVLV